MTANTFQDRAVASVLAAALAFALPSAARAGEAKTTGFGDWQLVSGSGAGACVIGTTVLLRESTTPAVTMNLFRQKGADGSDAEGAMVTLKVPTGVSLPAGIAYRHGGAREAIGFAWQYCGPETCLASGRISETEIGRLRRANRIEVGFRPLPNSRPVSIPVSLSGFTAAWRALERCLARAG